MLQINSYRTRKSHGVILDRLPGQRSHTQQKHLASYVITNRDPRQDTQDTRHPRQIGLTPTDSEQEQEDEAFIQPGEDTDARSDLLSSEEESESDEKF